MTKAERGQAMIAAIRHFTHPAHHMSGEDYSLIVVKLVLQVVTAAIAAGSF